MPVVTEMPHNANRSAARDLLYRAIAIALLALLILVGLPALASSAF